MLEGPFEGGTILASIASRWLLEPGYMHSFAITSHYYILIEQVSSLVEGDDGLYRPRCQSNLDFLPLEPLRWVSICLGFLGRISVFIVLLT